MSRRVIVTPCISDGQRDSIHFEDWFETITVMPKDMTHTLPTFNELSLAHEHLIAIKERAGKKFYGYNRKNVFSPEYYMHSKYWDTEAGKKEEERRKKERKK
jgi:hypothetical protein